MEEAQETIKGINQEIFNSTRNIILSGFRANQTPDNIKSAIFKSGVPFSKLNKIYSYIVKDENLVISSKEISEGISGALTEYGESLLEAAYSEIAELVEAIIENVKGSTKGKCMAAIRKLFLENEKELPRKSAPIRGRMGTVAKTLINVFAENSEATEEDCKEALTDVVKTEKNASDYAKQYHKMLFAVANGLTANKVLTVFSDNK